MCARAARAQPARCPARWSFRIGIRTLPFPRLVSPSRDVFHRPPPSTKPDPVAANTSRGPVRCARPFFLGPVPIQFHAVTIRIAQIECFTHAMIRRSFEGNACLLQSSPCVAQFCPRRIKNRQMIKPGRSLGWRPATFTLPSVQSDVMMIPTPRREMRPTIRSAASVQTQAHHDKIQARVPSPPLSNARDPSGHWDELLSPPRG